MRELFPNTVEAQETILRPLWLKWGALAGFWTFLALLYGNQTYFSMRAEGMDHQWWRIILYQVLVWNIWTALTPLILWAGRRFPIERSRWWRGVLAHLPIFVVVSAANIAACVAILMTLRPYDVWSSTQPFWAQYYGKLYARFPQDFLVYSAILGVGYAFDYRERYREREAAASELKAQLAQAQLEALKVQLHPHFLFNTLHTISGLVRGTQTQPAVNMIAGLSELLRRALDSADEQEVPLGEEI